MIIFNPCINNLSYCEIVFIFQTPARMGRTVVLVVASKMKPKQAGDSAE